ncbi:MAG: tetratricopeptide repeat protein, partial [Pseudomonadota bacterium]
PMAAMAAGGGTPTPPKPSETTTTCAEGLVWDLATQSCMTPEASTNDDSARLNDVRELAYAGQYAAALDVLDTLENPGAPLALTYYGFAHRKAGDIALGMEYYTRAIAADPDNLLARSYMGQGFVAAGDIAQAEEQLIEIRLRGGQNSWAETSLAAAITTGAGYSY